MNVIQQLATTLIVISYLPESVTVNCELETVPPGEPTDDVEEAEYEPEVEATPKVFKTHLLEPKSSDCFT